MSVALALCPFRVRDKAFTDREWYAIQLLHRYLDEHGYRCACR